MVGALGFLASNTCTYHAILLLTTVTQALVLQMLRQNLTNLLVRWVTSSTFSKNYKDAIYRIFISKGTSVPFLFALEFSAQHPHLKLISIHFHGENYDSLSSTRNIILRGHFHIMLRLINLHSV